MQDGWLAPAPIWDDLRTFDGRPWRGLVDFVFGGIPCQPHSLAGKRGGGADERDLWPDFWRVVCEVGPRLVLVENVPGMLSSDGGTVMGRILGDLAAGGYDAEWDCIPAAAVCAPHRRDRVWVVAYARSAPDGQQHSHEGERRDLPQPDPQLAYADCGGCACTGHEQTGDREGRQARTDCALSAEGAVADAKVQPVWPGLREGEQAGQRGRRPGDGCGEGPAGWWELEPGLCGLANGVATRVG
jgi:DNA (cytosine-5)-methyltransferase 1